MPSRTMFRGRIWPEGFEFPACNDCNQATKYEEQVVSMLSRIYTDGTSPQHKEEIQESIRAVAANRPQVLLEMKPDRDQERRAIEKYRLELHRMPDGQLPILSVRGPHISSAIEKFTRKLYCALFYRHAGEILSKQGGILFRWYTNIQIEADEIPRDLAPLLSGFPVLQRARTKLDDQFFYRWVVSQEKNMAVFLSFFRRSFAILGFVSDDADVLKRVDAEEGERHRRESPFQLVRPYDYTTHNFR